MLNKKALEDQIDQMTTEEVNLADEELNLPDHRFTQQAADLAK